MRCHRRHGFGGLGRQRCCCFGLECTDSTVLGPEPTFRPGAGGWCVFFSARMIRIMSAGPNQVVATSLESAAPPLRLRSCVLAIQRCRSRAAGNRQTVLLPHLRPCGRPAVVSCDRACSVFPQSGSGPQNGSESDCGGFVLPALFVQGPARAGYRTRFRGADWNCGGHKCLQMRGAGELPSRFLSTCRGGRKPETKFPPRGPKAGRPPALQVAMSSSLARVFQLGWSDLTDEGDFALQVRRPGLQVGAMAPAAKTNKKPIKMITYHG